MKKKISAFLALALSAAMLASCAPTQTTETTPQFTTSVYPPQFDIETIKAYGYFTGTVSSVEVDSFGYRTAKVAVDYRYTIALGETVEVCLRWIPIIEIKSGDKIRVTLQGSPIATDGKCYPDDIQLTALADGREIFEESFMTTYNIPALADVTVPADFPNLGTFNKEYTGLTKVNQSFPDCEAFRVIEISENDVYLADTETNSVTVGINGVPSTTFAVGNYVKISAGTYYLDVQTQYSVVDISDIKKVTLLSAEEAMRVYMPPILDKPVIYLYPEDDTTVSVKVNIDGELTCTYPEHGEDGWQNFTAKPDGTILSPDGREYYCLYWEGLGNMTPDFSKGFCVKGEDTAEFLADILEKIGLTPREANEFIIYWLPILQKNEYNLISFQSEAYTAVAELEITPTPDSILRVFMAAKPLSAPVEIAPQEFAGFERMGFTVVEWGGGIIE